MIANELNKRELRYLLSSYTGYGFRVEYLTQGSRNSALHMQGRKISDFCLKQGQVYRVPLPGLRARLIKDLTASIE